MLGSSFFTGYIVGWDLIQRKQTCSVGLRHTPGLKVDRGQPHRSELYHPGKVQKVAGVKITGYRWSVCAGLYVD